MTTCTSCGCAIDGALDPSPAEARVLAVVLAFHDQHGIFPTYRHIKTELRLGSVPAVAVHVNNLGRKGWLRVEKGKGITSARRPG